MFHSLYTAHAENVPVTVYETHTEVVHPIAFEDIVVDSFMLLGIFMIGLLTTLIFLSFWDALRKRVPLQTHQTEDENIDRLWNEIIEEKKRHIDSIKALSLTSQTNEVAEENTSAFSTKEELKLKEPENRAYLVSHPTEINETNHKILRNEDWKEILQKSPELARFCNFEYFNFDQIFRLLLKNPELSKWIPTDRLTVNQLDSLNNGWIVRLRNDLLILLQKTPPDRKAIEEKKQLLNSMMSLSFPSQTDETDQPNKTQARCSTSTRKNTAHGTSRSISNTTKKKSKS
jgi:hypothetical protein